MKPLTRVGTPAYRAEREEFIAALTVPVCWKCQDTATPPVVIYEDRFWCIRHANDELILDLGRHGELAIPALAFAGLDR